MKRIKRACVCAGAVLMIGGCSSAAGTADTEQIAQLESKIEKLESENESLEADNESLTALISAAEETETAGEADETQAETAGVAADALALGDPIVLEDVLEMTLTSYEWLFEIKPSNPSGAYSYYKGTEGETYLAVKGTVKNISSVAIDVDDIQSSEIMLNDKYKFHAFWTCEEAGGERLEDSVKPLQTLDVVIYAAVSNEAKDIFEHAALTMKISSNPEQTNWFSESDPHETFVLKFDNAEQ